MNHSSKFSNLRRGSREPLDYSHVWQRLWITWGPATWLTSEVGGGLVGLSLHPMGSVLTLISVRIGWSWIELSDTQLVSENWLEEGKNPTHPVYAAFWMWEERKRQWISLTVVTCRPGRELSPEPHRAGNLVLDLQPPELWGNKSRRFQPPGLQCFVCPVQYLGCTYTKKWYLIYLRSRFVCLAFVFANSSHPTQEATLSISSRTCFEWWKLAIAFREM